MASMLAGMGGMAGLQQVGSGQRAWGGHVLGRLLV